MTELVSVSFLWVLGPRRSLIFQHLGNAINHKHQEVLYVGKGGRWGEIPLLRCLAPSYLMATRWGSPVCGLSSRSLCCHEEKMEKQTVFFFFFQFNINAQRLSGTSVANGWAYFQLHYYFKQNACSVERYLAVFSELLSPHWRVTFPRVCLKGTHLYLQVNISNLSEEKNVHPRLLIQKQLVFQQDPIFNLNSAPAILNVTKKCNPEIMPGAKSIKGTSE